MALLYSALFVCVCISLLLHPHVAKYYATTAYASRENSKRTDFITSPILLLIHHSTTTLSVCLIMKLERSLMWSPASVAT